MFYEFQVFDETAELKYFDILWLIYAKNFKAARVQYRN